MKYYVYQITNKLNGKIYIGYHGSDKEFLDDNYYGSGCLIKKALNKYDKECFERVVLFEYDNDIDAKAKEREIVNEDFLKRDDVYNIALGGSGGGLLGEANPFFGRTHSEESKKKMSETQTGVMHSEENKKKIGEGVKNSEKYKAAINEERSKKIASSRRKKSGKNIEYYITPNGNFDMANDAAKNNNIPWRALILRCENNLLTVKPININRDTSKRLTKDMIGKTWKELGWGVKNA